MPPSPMTEIVNRTFLTAFRTPESTHCFMYQRYGELRFGPLQIQRFNLPRRPQSQQFLVEFFVLSEESMTNLPASFILPTRKTEAPEVLVLSIPPPSVPDLS